MGFSWIARQQNLIWMMKISQDYQLWWELLENQILCVVSTKINAISPIQRTTHLFWSLWHQDQTIHNSSVCGEQSGLSQVIHQHSWMDSLWVRIDVTDLILKTIILNRSIRMMTMWLVRFLLKSKQDTINTQLTQGMDIRVINKELLPKKFQMMKLMIQSNLIYL